MSALFPFFTDSSRHMMNEVNQITPDMLPTARHGKGRVEADIADIAKSYARIFASDDGRRVLDHMQLSTLYRAYGPDSSDASLRHMEGQRYFLSQVLKHIERGRQGA